MNSATPSLNIRVADWLGLIRFSHTIFALPFAALAAVFALCTPLSDGSYPVIRLGDILGILLCMVFARSAAMAFNRLVDRDIDAENPRTASRHIPAGILAPGQVAFFTLLSGLAFVCSTALFLPNRWPLIMSVPVLIFLCGYSLAKRFTSAAHLWLGIALALSPICVWIAIRGGYPGIWTAELAIPVVLAAVVATWVNGFDIIYACQDQQFDADAGLNSVPAKMGVKNALTVAKLSHIVMLGCLGLLAWVASPSGIGLLFVGVILVVAVLILYQHRLVSSEDLDRVNQAFFHVNAIISVLLLAAGFVDCLLI